MVSKQRCSSVLLVTRQDKTRQDSGYFLSIRLNQCLEKVLYLNGWGVA